MANLTAFKGVMIAVIFMSGLFGVLSPRLFKPYSSRLSYASLFSSGILLSAALVHLLFDASQGLAESFDFPFAFFFCGLSFYFLYFFERWVIHLLAHSHSGHHKKNPKEVSLLSDTDNNNIGITPTSTSQGGAAIQHVANIHSFDHIDDKQTMYVILTPKTSNQTHTLFEI